MISATVTETKPYTGGNRDDVDTVVARFDYAIGATWWVATRGEWAVGDRVDFTLARRPIPGQTQLEIQ